MMKNPGLVFVALLMCAATAFAQAPSPAATPPTPTVAGIINGQISSVEKEFVPLVEAMPEDKFNFAPTNGEFKGVRDFGTMVKHVAVTNTMMAAAMLQEPTGVAKGDEENGPAAIKTKAEIVQYLKDSFARLHKAADGISEKNLLSPIQSPYGPRKTTRLNYSISVLAHARDHYGQLVEYLRDNGIIPPASRGN